MYIQQKAAIMLQKRDNMGFAISPALIIFLVILGAGFMVCCGFAVVRFYGGDIDQNQYVRRNPEQDAYMRKVRERNWNKLPRLGVRPIHRPSNANMAHAPMSPSGNSTTTYG
ncbi:hypothetical protein EK21DRAFT_74590 [Setomelanomma holmii]|uniref:Uncharacterized protein n=1 Tax=Setomelanomma holmii TaxID=210430 RepID=A0A9P4LJ49_9PLEO|nr:hypothetical protein EK21DRAFT_74590 [Setomelanomma holmii]